VVPLKQWPTSRWKAAVDQECDRVPRLQGSPVGIVKEGAITGTTG
jgi:hypothetical protein